MKKIYVEVELEVISLKSEDVIATSEYGYDPDNTLDNENNNAWDW